MDSGALTYFPEKRFLSCPELVQVALSKNGDEEVAGLFDYLLTFAAAAVFAARAIRALNIKVSAYVGFDSGDVARIAN